MPDEKLPIRSLAMTVILALLLMTICFLVRIPRMAWGIGIGASLSVFSLGTLIYVIPRLFVPGKSSPRFWMGFVTFLKLPIFMIVLYYAIRSESHKYIDPVGVFSGVALGPLTIMLKVLGWQLVHTPDQSDRR